jgi:hypothetical protein
MAKRFFDTGMRRKPWFRALRGPVREAWGYLLAECDIVGIWEIDIEDLNFVLGIKQGDPDWVTLDELLAVKNFGLQIVEGDKLWISGFVEFQYADDEGLISPGNKLLPKLSSMLKARGLPLPRLKPSLSPSHPPSTPHPSPTHGVKEKEEEEDKERKGGAGGKPTEADSTPPQQPEPSVDDDPPASATPEPSPPEPEPAFGPGDLAAAWNERMEREKTADGDPMPLVDMTRMNHEQERWWAADAAMLEKPVRPWAEWLDVIDRIARSKFCRGKGTKNGWVADFDFLVRPGVATAVLEGKYGCRPPPRLRAVARGSPLSPESEKLLALVIGSILAGGRGTGDFLANASPAARDLVETSFGTWRTLPIEQAEAAIRRDLVALERGCAPEVAT